MRDTGPAIPFGAGAHFCAGAAASKFLIAGHAVPILVQQPGAIEMDGAPPFAGRAFRGPTSCSVRWKS